MEVTAAATKLARPALFGKACCSLRPHDPTFEAASLQIKGVRYDLHCKGKIPKPSLQHSVPVEAVVSRPTLRQCCHHFSSVPKVIFDIIIQCQCLAWRTRRKSSHDSVLWSRVKVGQRDCGANIQSRNNVFQRIHCFFRQLLPSPE